MMLTLFAAITLITFMTCCLAALVLFVLWEQQRFEAQPASSRASTVQSTGGSAVDSAKQAALPPAKPRAAIKAPPARRPTTVTTKAQDLPRPAKTGRRRSLPSRPPAIPRDEQLALPRGRQ